MEYPQSEANKAKAKAIIEAQERRISRRSVWETHWQECLDYIIPRKGDVVTKNIDGEKKGIELYDSTATLANELLASALHGMLTNPSTRFFDLVFGDPEFDDDDMVKEWLQEVANRMFMVLNNSNFQTEIHEIYLDLGALGTAALFMGEHDENVVHFSARHMKEITVEENNLGLIDSVDRLFEWKPRHIIQEFGEDKVPPFVLEAHRKGCEDLWQVIHATYPVPDGKPHPVASCYVLKEQQFVLHEGGFHEEPWAVPRWTKTSGETYGRGPGMNVLPDTKMANAMMKTIIEGGQMAVKPPLQVPDDGVVGRVRLTPSGLTVVRAGAEQIRPLIAGDTRIDYGFELVNDVRQRIRQGFLTDKIQLNQSQGTPKTATEIDQIVDQSLRFMGPVLGRQHFELLRPMINRVFGIMNRRGLLPEAPAKIQGKKFDVRYSSVVARAQRMAEGSNLNRAIAAIAPILQLDPKAALLINSFDAVRYILDIYGAPQKVIRNQKELQTELGKLADAQAQQAQIQKEQHEAEMASKVLPGAAAMAQVQKA